MNHHIYLALGTNLGDRPHNLIEALGHLKTAVQLTQISFCYDTAPWGVVDQPRFLNLVCGGQTTLTAQELLTFTKRIEARMGRRDGLRYGPRVIDIDILLYDDLILHDEKLTLPHPRLPERVFVLQPFADIAPEVVHPLTQQTIAAMLKTVDKDGIERLPLDLSGIIS